MSIRIFRRKFPAAAWILVGMVLGIIVGYMIFTSFPDKKRRPRSPATSRSSPTSSCA